MPNAIDLTDFAGDLVALQIVAQRVFALLALATGNDNTFLDQQRVSLLEVLGKWKVSGISDTMVKARAETCINKMFDEMRITPAPGGPSPS
jgi:hypothetical protein